MMRASIARVGFSGVLAACAVLGAACARERTTPTTSAAASNPGVSSVVHAAELQVAELTCEGCASQIREILGPLPGVVDVRTNVKQKTVTVEFDTTAVTVDDVVAALAREKYTASPAAVRK